MTILEKIQLKRQIFTLELQKLDLEENKLEINEQLTKLRAAYSGESEELLETVEDPPSKRVEEKSKRISLHQRDIYILSGNKAIKKINPEEIRAGDLIKIFDITTQSYCYENKAMLTIGSAFQVQDRYFVQVKTAKID